MFPDRGSYRRRRLETTSKEDGSGEPSPPRAQTARESRPTKLLINAPLACCRAPPLLDCFIRYRVTIATNHGHAIPVDNHPFPVGEFPIQRPIEIERYPIPPTERVFSLILTPRSVQIDGAALGEFNLDGPRRESITILKFIAGNGQGLPRRSFNFAFVVGSAAGEQDHAEKSQPEHASTSHDDLRLWFRSSARWRRRIPAR